MALLLLACGFALLGQPEDGATLRLGEQTGPLRYTVSIEGPLLQGGETVRLRARFAADYRAFAADREGLVPVLVVLGEGEGSYQIGEREAPLVWTYRDRPALLLLSRDSVIHEAPIPLPPAGPAPSMDPLAAYLAAAWWVPLPEGTLHEGDSFMRDIEGELGLTGEALTDRRVVAQVERIGREGGRRVAVLAAEVEETLRDDHPQFRGRALLSIHVAFDADTGVLLAARIIENGETAPRDGNGPPVRTQNLDTRVQLDGGPEFEL